jgi:hypothetical protein
MLARGRAPGFVIHPAGDPQSGVIARQSAAISSKKTGNRQPATAVLTDDR